MMTKVISGKKKKNQPFGRRITNGRIVRKWTFEVVLVKETMSKWCLVHIRVFEDTIYELFLKHGE